MGGRPSSISALSPSDPDRVEKVHQLKSKTAQILMNIGEQRLIFVERKKLDLCLDGKSRTPETRLSPLENIEFCPLGIQLDDVRHKAMIGTDPIQRLTAQWNLPKDIKITHIRIQLPDQLRVRLQEGGIRLMPRDM